jgi:hypothetical protein
MERHQAGAQQLCEIAAAPRRARLRHPAREDVPAELGPVLQPVRGLAQPRASEQLATQGLGFRLGCPGGRRIGGQQQARP